jgi:hypothetical protein
MKGAYQLRSATTGRRIGSIEGFIGRVSGEDSLESQTGRGILNNGGINGLGDNGKTNIVRLERDLGALGSGITQLEGQSGINDVGGLESGAKTGRRIELGGIDGRTG